MEAVEACTRARRVVANTAVRAVHVAQIACRTRAQAALGCDTTAVSLVRRCHGVIGGWASSHGTVYSEPLGLLALS